LLRDATVRVAFMWKATVKGDVMSKTDSWQLRKKKEKAISDITYHEILARLWHSHSDSGKERKHNDRTIIILVTNMLSSCTHLHA